MASSQSPFAQLLPRLDLRPRAGATATAEWALLPLRLFLGFTFAFAGLQKLSNPNFFIASAPISIQHQLAGAAHFSPIHALLHAIVPYAGVVGMVIAYSEIAIGLGTLLGFFSRTAALGGAVLSFNLFLAISFHSSPYFTGADIVFFFAWLPLVITPGGAQLSLDAYLLRAVRARAERANAARSSRTPVEITSVDRRTVVATAAAVGTATLLLGGATAAIGKLIGNATPHPGTTSTTTTTTTAGATGAGPGHLLGTAASVPVGSAATFTIPSSGDPGIVFHNADGSWTAYDTVCPHAGCTVGWSQGASLLICPCHGSQFQVATGAVTNGPAPHGLTTLKVVESGGHIYLV